MWTLILDRGASEQVIKGNSGFTLIEMMVVLALIALSSVFLTLKIQSHSQLENEIEQLQLSIETAAEKAEIEGTALQLELLPSAYRFNRADMRGQWVLVEDDPRLKEQSLASEVTWLGLKIDNATSPLQLAFSGSEMPAFELHVGTAKGNLSLHGLPNGSVSLVEDKKAVF